MEILSFSCNLSFLVKNSAEFCLICAVYMEKSCFNEKIIIRTVVLKSFCLSTMLLFMLIWNKINVCALNFASLRINAVRACTYKFTNSLSRIMQAKQNGTRKKCYCKIYILSFYCFNKSTKNGVAKSKRILHPNVLLLCIWKI